MTVFNTRIRRIARRALAALAAVACTMSLAACGADESGKIRIGIKFDQPGLGFKKSGTYVGFDVDVAKYVAKKLGYSEDEIVWKEAPSKQREAMLQNGDVDMILATYSITDERKNAVSFAGPYFVAGQDLLVRKDDHSINGPEDLNGKRLRLAWQAARRRQAVHAGILRRGHQEGRHGARQEDQRRHRRDDQGRFLGARHRRQH